MDSTTGVYEQQPKGFFPQVEVAALYVNFKGRLLLLELSPLKLECGAWGVPGGKIEAGENPVEAAQRELLEETGIRLELEGSFKYLGKLFVTKPEVHYVYYLFHVMLPSKPAIQLSKEHTSFRWVLREEAERLPLMKGAKQALDAYYRWSSG